VSLDRIANIATNLREPPIGLAGFGVPLTAAILTAPQETLWDSIYGASVDTAEFTSANFLTLLSALSVSTSEDLHISLTDLFSQERSPSLALVGRRATAVAQVELVDITGTDDGDYTVTINGTDFTFAASSDTADDIEAGLISAVNAGSEPVTAAPGTGDQLSLTADEAGVPFTLSVEAPSDNLTASTDTANTGIPEDITTWTTERNDWYALLETTRSSGVIGAAANTIEALDKVLIAQTDDAAAQTSATTDIGSELNALGLLRTMLWWHDNDDEFVDAAIAGKMLPTQPGSETWANQSLASVTGFLPTSETFLANKKYNWLESFSAAGFSMTQGGWMAGGQWMDVIRGRDWLKNRLQIAIIQALRDSGKIPYTEEGDAVIASTILAVLHLAASPRVKLIVADSIQVNVPGAANQSSTDRGNRHYPGVTWSATLQGAVHTLDVTGSLAP
jgi:hypothetical protein